MLEVNLYKCEVVDVWCVFICLVKCICEGDMIWFGELMVCVECKLEGGDMLLCFDYFGVLLDEVIVVIGVLFLLFYIVCKCGVDEQDNEDYQILFVCEEGSVVVFIVGLYFME